MRAEAIVVAADTVKDVAGILRDWCRATESGDGFVKKDSWEVHEDGSITAVFNGKKDTLTFDELARDLKSNFNCFEIRFEGLRYLGDGKYLCREHIDVGNQHIPIEVRSEDEKMSADKMQYLAEQALDDNNERIKENG